MMPKYCPTCFCEFTAAIEKCPKDKTALVSKKPKEFERLVDIYAASNEIEAERIITFLRDDGIFAREALTGISQMPVVSDTKFIITVLKEFVEPAKTIIEQARTDGIISTNGNFI